MDFEYSDKTKYHLGLVQEFMDKNVYPNEDNITEEINKEFQKEMSELGYL